MTTLFAAGASFRFQTPSAFLLLIPALWLALRILSPRRREAFLFSSLTVFGSLPQTWATRLFPVVRALVPAGLILAVAALARPRWGEQENSVENEGIAMAICLDRSGSMRNDDFVLNGKRVERFDAVKKIFNDFVLGDGKFSGRPNDKIALVVFGGYVDALCPLTLDHEALAEMLRTVHVPNPPVNRYGQMVPDQLFQEESATAIGDALAAAVGRLKDADAKSKVIILLSDGVQNVGAVTAEEAADSRSTTRRSARPPRSPAASTTAPKTPRRSTASAGRSTNSKKAGTRSASTHFTASYTVGFSSRGSF